MDRFIKFMEKYFVPAAAKIGGQRHLVAIRDGFVTVSPLIMAGAFAVLINNISFKWYQKGMDALLPANWKDFGINIYNGSFAILSILVTCTIAYHLAKSYEKDGIGAAMLSLGVTMLLYVPNADGSIPNQFLGGAGLFVAIAVALITTELFVKLSGNPRLIIKMPPGVPPAVSKSFAALIPSIIILAIAAVTKLLFGYIGIPNINLAVFTAIQIPLQGVVGSFWGLIILILVQQLLWFFGLHGSNILAPIISAVLLPLTEANMAAVNAGVAPTHIVNSQFLDAFVNMGGSGVTIALIIAIFIAGRKSKTQMTIAKLGAAPGCFNINEPVIFGMPLVLNPIYIIPFIIAPIVSATIAYGLTYIGFVPKVSIVGAWTTPPVLGAVISTNSWQGGAVAVLCIVISVLIYLPFVRMATKQELAAEEEMAS